MQTRRTAAAVAAFLSFLVAILPAGARADEPPPPSAAQPDTAHAERVQRGAEGFGIAVDNGLWGTGFASGLRLEIPFHRHFGLRARGLIAYGPATQPDFDPAVFGGVEVFGRGPVMFGLARLYGGGGVHIGGRPNPADDGDSFGVSGGGHMGIEVFMSPSYSYSVEIGGQGGVHALQYDAGASVMGGMTWYLGG
ncbi:MAG: hypothetical protein WKG00_33945 [Polyangiaceae bacterium]